MPVIWKRIWHVIHGFLYGFTIQPIAARVHSCPSQWLQSNLDATSKMISKTLWGRAVEKPNLGKQWGLMWRSLPRGEAKLFESASLTCNVPHAQMQRSISLRIAGYSPANIFISLQKMDFDS